MTSVGFRVAALDSSPLLLLLAGRTDPLIIVRFKHLAMFRVDDYELLDRLVAEFEVVLTTPHVLTEVSNHAHHLKGSLGTDLLLTFTAFARDTKEQFDASSVLSERAEFQRLGIADCALAALDRNTTVITTDYRLAGERMAAGRAVVNLNHLRQSGVSG